MKKILIILGLIVVIGGLLWFGLSYWIGGSIGGGGMQQYAPDTVQAGEPADITIIATATGGGGNIQGRFTNLSLHYRLVGENTYKAIQPQQIDLPDNFKTVQSKTFQSETYKFTIPPYPKGTTGEIEYYTEMTFDGYQSHQDGVKKIKIISSPTTSASVSSNQKTGCSLLPYTGTTTLSQLPYYSPSYDGVDEDLRGGMICNFTINSKLPVFTFHFLGQPDNTLGNIQITQGDSTKIIQTITNDTDPNALAPAKSSSVLKPVDVNFDGYLDLPILNNCGATGNCSYDFYLYDPTTNQFLKNSFLTNLGGFKPDQIDSVKKQITASWNSSVADWQQATYQYQGGQYVMIKKVISSWDRDKNMGTVETYELHDSKMELTNSTTTPE